MTPVKKYVEAQVTSGGLRAEIHYMDHDTSPRVMVELDCKPGTMLTAESMSTFTSEVAGVAEDEARNHGGGRNMGER